MSDASPPPTRAVLFDMTGTLHPQSELEAAARAALGVLVRHYGVEDPAALAQAVRAGMHAAMTARMSEPFYLIADLMAAGYSDGAAATGLTVDRGVVESAVAAFIDVLTSTVTLYPGVIDVLEVLRRNGLATGIVSVNDEAPLQAMVERTGLRPHLDLVLSSEAARSCKPHPAIFELALERLGTTAAETVFVGDMPLMDIAGAKAIGMRAVLTTEDVGFLAQAGGDIADLPPEQQPDRVIASIRELPVILGLA